MRDFLMRVGWLAGREILLAREAVLAGWATRKGDGSPVTEADRRAHEVVTRYCQSCFPDIPVISEEGSRRLRGGERAWWLLDPLDGTEEFIRSGDEFCVNLALIRRGIVVAGMVMAPMLGFLLLWDGVHPTARMDFTPDILVSRPEGICMRESPARVASPAGIRWGEDGHPRCVNGRLRVLCSRYHRDEQTEILLANHTDWVSAEAGAGIKFARLALGEADYYPRLNALHGWDVAAGHAVLKGAGGQVWSLGTWEELRYDDLDGRVGPFRACGFTVKP